MTIESAPSGKYIASATSTSYSGNLISLPKYVGGYQMGDFRFNLTTKPAWWHRLGVRLVLGWKWVDA